MKRKLFLFCFLLSAYFVRSQEVGIVVNSPVNAGINEEFKVEITITKGDVLGFARLQIDFPEGFTVTSNQTAGSNFTFKDGKARFLWMSLPADNVLNVVCIVKSSDGGDKQFEGSFSYVLNNETNRSSFPAKNITIGTGTTVIAAVTNIETETVSQAERLEADRRAREEAITRAEVERVERERVESQRLAAERRAREEALVREETERMEAERRERALAETNQEEVTLVRETTTEEVVLVEINTSEETQRIEDERRAREEALVRAEQERRDAEARERAALEQQQNIVVVDVNVNNEETARMEAERRNQELAAATRAEAEAQARRQEQERLARENADAERRAREAAERRVREEEAERVRREANARAEAEIMPNERIANERRSTTPVVAASSTGVNFRVQIGASRRPAEQGYYRNIERAIPEYPVVKNDGNDGWFRYTMGSFNSVSEAQLLLNKLKQLGHEAFITAFKDGQKITIVEAKRILGQ